MAASQSPVGDARPQPDLDALLVTEERLEQLLAQARAEADAVRAAAEAEILRGDAQAAAELEDARRALTEQLATEAAARIAELEAVTRSEAAGWDALTGPALDQAAALLLGRLAALIAEAT